MTVVSAIGGLATLQLEGLVDESPAALPPRVRVTVTGVASAMTFTLTRLCEGESWGVPGWRARRFTDSDVDVDWVPPLNRAVTYTLSADGVAVCTATIVVESVDSVVQDPIQPDRFLQVLPRGLESGKLTMASGALESFEYANQSSRIQVMGSRYPVGLGGQRSAASGVALPLVSPDSVTSDLFRSVLADTPILVFRPAFVCPLPPTAYLLASASEEPSADGSGFSVWPVSGDLVSAVVQAAVSGFVTYDEVQQLLAGVSYDEVQAVFSGLTYLDVMKDPLSYAAL
jgi:hypothetical protein